MNEAGQFIMPRRLEVQSGPKGLVGLIPDRLSARVGWILGTEILPVQPHMNFWEIHASQAQDDYDIERPGLTIESLTSLDSSIFCSISSGSSQSKTWNNNQSPALKHPRSRTPPPPKSSRMRPSQNSQPRPQPSRSTPW